MNAKVQYLITGVLEVLVQPQIITLKGFGYELSKVTVVFADFLPTNAHLWELTVCIQVLT